MLARVLSGGQTGVDRAALDAALERGLPCGGWCPRGRRAEDGRVPDRYPLRETASAAYPERTLLNLLDADGTLVLTRERPRGGSALTLGLARRHGKPHLHLDLSRAPQPEAALDFLVRERIGVLNVAGPREGECPGIYAEALGFLRTLFERAGRETAPQPR